MSKYKHSEECTIFRAGIICSDESGKYCEEYIRIEKDGLNGNTNN